ncbi:hypothetical protein LCGC14_2477370, partial [marine sediment metagenome]
GINISQDKLEMGYRDEAGWHELEEHNARLKPDRDYEVLLALNGTVATLVVNGKDVFTHVFAPRIIYGYQYNLNAGLVGIGANNSKARIDNVAVQVLPPEFTYESAEDFSDGVADGFTVLDGDWQVQGGDYDASAVVGDMAISRTSLEIRMSSLLEIGAMIQTDAIGGVVFDAYGPEDFKFVALSEDTQEVLIGHYTARRGWKVDASASWQISSNEAHELGLSIKGTTVSVLVDGQAVLGHSFNGVAVDGDFGLLSRDGATTFDDFTVRTNDPAFAGDNLLATAATQRGMAEELTEGQLASIASEAIDRWSAVSTIDASALAALRFEIVDLPGIILGRATENAVLIDPTAAGYGWFVDVTPKDDSEFRQMGGSLQPVAATERQALYSVDLLTVVLHEAGHVLGLDHMIEAYDVMASSLPIGVRRLPSDVSDLTVEIGLSELSRPLDVVSSLAGPSLVTSGSWDSHAAWASAQMTQVLPMYDGTPAAFGPLAGIVEADEGRFQYALAEG